MTQGHLLLPPEPPRGPGTGSVRKPHPSGGVVHTGPWHRALSAALQENSPSLSGSLQFKNIKVPVVLVFYGLSYPRWDIVKGDGSDHVARNLLKVCKVMKFGEQNSQVLWH